MHLQFNHVLGLSQISQLRLSPNSLSSSLLLHFTLKSNLRAKPSPQIGLSATHHILAESKVLWMPNNDVGVTATVGGISFDDVAMP